MAVRGESRPLLARRAFRRRRKRDLFVARRRKSTIGKVRRRLPALRLPVRIAANSMIAGKSRAPSGVQKSRRLSGKCLVGSQKARIAEFHPFFG
jgi:hypothetical protein